MGHTFIEWLARAGYASRGVVYLLVGGFAILAAIGSAVPQDSKGALEALALEPAGPVIIGILAVGLAGFSVWRLVQALTDADGHGTGARAVVVRSGLLGSAAIYGSLCFFCVKLALELKGGGGGDPTAEWLANMLDSTVQRVVFVVIGLLIFASAGAHLYKGATAGFTRWFEAPDGVMRWLDPVSRFGLIVRGLTILGAGIFIVAGTVLYQADEAKGLEDALDWIQGQSFGWPLLVVTGLGLMAFGVYSISESIYRKIEPGSEAP